MFAYRSRLDRVDVAFTDRHGGVSSPPFASLNFGYASGDDAGAVARNVALVAEALGTDDSHLVSSSQVHGAAVAEVNGTGEKLGRADALVTARVGVTLCVRAADCVPVLIADADAGIVAAAHAGRTGMAAGVVPRVVEATRRLGAARIVAWVGPHICGRCYEVPEALRDEVSDQVPAAFATTRWGTPALDLGAGVRSQLEEHDCDVVEVGRCTFEDSDLFSYRRDGARSGRQAGLISLRS